MQSEQRSLAPQIAVLLIGFAIAIVCAMWTGGDIGIISKEKIPAGARSGANLEDDLACSVSYGDRVTALVFFDEADPDNTANTMVYVNRTGVYGSLLKKKMALGWFFRFGGPLPAGGGASAVRYTVEGYSECAYFAPAAAGIVRAVAPDGAEYAFDAGQPLALAAAPGLVFYDAAGAQVPCADSAL